MLRNLISGLAPTSRVSKSDKRHSQSKRSQRRSLRVESLESRIVFDGSLATVLINPDTRIFDTYLDNAGNTYQTGLYAGRVDFDPSVERADGSDILENQFSTLYSGLSNNSRSFVVKYNADGSFAWVRSLQAISEAITADANGNVFAGGRFFGTSSIANQNLTSVGGTDAFYAKYSSNGDALWARRDGTTSPDGIYDLATDSSGSVVARMHTGNFATAFYSQRIIKTSSSGTVQWSRQFDNVTSQVNGGLAVDSTGSIVVAGAFRNTVDFDPGPKRRLISSVGDSSGFILKLTNAGAFSWVSTFRGAVDTTTNTIGSSNVVRMDLDPSNNIILFGAYSGRVDFDPGSGVKNLPLTDNDFVAKFNSNGRLTWAQSFALPSTADMTVRSVTTGPDGSVYLGGYIDVYNPPIYVPTYVDLDPGSGVSSHLISVYQGFVIKLAASGAFVWSEVLEHETGESTISDLKVDSSNTLILEGSFVNATVDLNPSDTVSEFYTADSTRKRFRARWQQS